MKINDVIRTKRLELGMTQEQVATRLGVVSAESADDQDEYRSTIDANYRRLASSAEPAVREMATGMLIAQAMQDEDYAQAQELADRVSVSRNAFSSRKRRPVRELRDVFARMPRRRHARQNSRGGRPL